MSNFLLQSTFLQFIWGFGGVHSGQTTRLSPQRFQVRSPVRFILTKILITKMLSYVTLIKGTVSAPERCDFTSSQQYNNNAL